MASGFATRFPTAPEGKANMEIQDLLINFNFN